MARKEKTPAERKAWGEKMKAAREAKKLVSTPPVAEPIVEVSPSAPETIQGESDIDVLKRQVQELKDALFFQQRQVPPAQNGATVSSRGITGTVTKYSTNPKDYPDPRDRLFDEAKLKLKGFNRDWWDLEWIVSRVNYDTKDGIHMAEPKFQIRLIRIIEDPETGEPSAKRYTLWKGTFFEDPEAAIQVAAQYGIEVGEEMEKEFLNEMRYLRVRDWLLEAFYPAKPSQDKMNKVETVIGNRLVEVFEVNSTSTETIPFSQISKKL
jgi:hypothetical protein